MKAGMRVLLATLVVAAAAPARAGWVQVAPPTGVSAAADLRAVVVAGAETWVVGQDGLAPVVLRGFETPALVPQAEHGASGALLVACGLADGSLHAFGNSNAHASWVAGIADWTNQALFPSVAPRSASCQAPDVVYVAGAFSVIDPFVGEWQVGSATATSHYPFLSSAIDAAGFRAVGDGLIGARSELNSFLAGSTASVPGAPAFSGVYRAIRFSSAGGLAVGRDTGSLKAVVLQVGAGNALTTGGDPGFFAVNDATLLDSGFAVVVGDAGAVAVSHDGGASWTSRPVAAGPNLLSVACRDEVHCYLSGATAALYYWSNEAPTAQITAVVDGAAREVVGGVLSVVGDETVCLTGTGVDLEQQPLSWLWSEASGTLKGLSAIPLDGSTVAVPECFVVPQCGGAFEIGATASDGELSGSAVLSLQASAAPIAPALALDFTNGFVDAGLLSGTNSTEASVTPTHPCATGFHFVWSCLDSQGAPFDPGDVSAASFANPGDLCQEQSINCSVAVTPVLAGQPSSSVEFSVRYAAAASRPTTLVTSFTNVSVQGVVAAGQTGSVTLAPENRCAASFSASWSCTDGIDPGPLALTRDFAHPGTTACGGEAVDCTVTILPDVGDSAQSAFTVRYEPSARPVLVESAFGGALAVDGRLAAGESGRATLTPSQDGCTTAFAATWSCSDGVNPAAGALYRDFTNARVSGCADETIDCSVEVISALTGESTSMSFSVVLSPNPGAVLAPTTFSVEFAGGDRLAPGQSGTVTLTPTQGSCTTSYQTAWSCSDGVNPAAGALYRDFTNARVSGCADETIDCTVEVTSALTGESTSTSFSVVLSPNPGAVLAPAIFSVEFAGGDRLAPGQSGTVTLAPAQGSCTTSYQTTWSCSDGVNTAAGVLFRDFTNARVSGCADETIDCSVEVISALTGESTSTSFSVVLSPNPGAVLAPATFSAEFGGGDRLAPGQSGTVTLAPTQGSCTTSYQTAWSCSDGVNPAAGALNRDFTNARVSGCADETIDCSVEVISALTGESTSTSFSVVLSPNPGAVLAPATFSVEFAGGDRLAPGQSGTVMLAPTQGSCTTSYQTAWSCSDGVNPAAGALYRDFTNARVSGCADETIDCSVEVTSALTGESTSTSFSVVLSPNPGAVLAPATFSVEFGGGDRLAPGQSGTVTLAPTQGSCTTSYQTAWSCSDGVNPAAGTLYRDFTNARVSGCADETIDCSVQVVSALTGESTTTSFSVALAPNPGPTEVAVSFVGFGAGNALGDGETGTVTAAASGECPGGFDYLWRCDGLPDATGPARSFTHDRPLCAEAGVRCTVEATALGVGRAGSAEVALTLLASAPFPASLAVELSGPASLAEGETVSAAILATHCPGATFSYAWECTGAGASGQGAAASFSHPGLLCEAARASCRVSVIATSLEGIAQPAAVLPAPIEVDYLPAFDPPANLRVVPLATAQDEVAAEAQLDAVCPFTLDYSWRATLRSSGELLGEGSGAQFGAALPRLCGSDFVDLALTEASTGLSAAAEFAVEGWRGAIGLEAPGEQGYEEQPRLDCAALEPIVFVPRASGCVRGFEWRQTDGVAVSFEQRGDGALVIRPEGGAFGALVGRQARFEVEAFNDESRSPARSVALTFVPKPFLAIRHTADRPMAAAGEQVGFVVELEGGCAAPPEAVDLHLALDDLDYVSGSARLDGALLAEPERTEAGLVFRGVPLAAGGPGAQRISYAARRRAIGSGAAASVASAYLSVAPAMRISEEAAAGSARDAGAVPVLSCSCGQSSSPLVLWAAGLALVLLRGRRRGGAC